MLILATVLLYIFKPLGEDFYIIGDSIVIIFSLLAFASGFYAYKIHGFKSVQGKALFLLTIGIFFWFLGESTWGFYEIVLGIEAPVASIADVFWLLGYPFFLGGAYFICRLAAIPLAKKKYMLFALIIAGLFCVLWLIYPTIVNPEISLAEKMSTTGYVIGDFAILIAMIFIVVYLSGSKFLKPWTLIIIGLVLSTIADIYYMNFIDVYASGDWIDILWCADYIITALGLFYYRETAEKIFADVGKAVKRQKNEAAS
jgi:hypothetical protein